MRKKILLLFPAVALGVLLDCFYNPTYSNAGGAPSARCGDPAGGFSTCAACHTGSAVVSKPGWITSDIPGTGYVPGSTYNLTATVSFSGRSKFGFEVSAQKSNGTASGTLVLVNTSETQLKGSGKYITHTSGGNTGANSRSWTFQWKAPGPGAGALTFYAAFVAANNSGSNKGDNVYTSTLAVQEQITAISETGTETACTVFPVPARDAVFIRYNGTGSVTNAALYDIGGNLVREPEELSGKGECTAVFPLDRSLPAGIYFLVLQQEEKRITRKVIISGE